MYDEMRELIDRREAAEREAQRAATSDERFDRIEQSISGLTDAVTQFVQGSAPEVRPPGDGGGREGGAEPPPPNPVPVPDPPPPELPVEVVTRLPVPRIYTGDDEPSEVRYTDPETGEEKTRAGRRKGHPAAYSVEPYEPPEPPQE